MRQLRYGVATSLDGFIAGSKGEYDWIVRDSGIDFAAMWARFDIVLMGRKTFEIADSMRASFSGSCPRWVVVSSALKPEDHSGVTILSTGIVEAVAALKAERGPRRERTSGSSAAVLAFASCSMPDWSTRSTFQ
jgi:dihydrofolate reductase